MFNTGGSTPKFLGGPNLRPTAHAFDYIIFDSKAKSKLGLSNVLAVTIMQKFNGYCVTYWCRQKLDQLVP